MSIWGSKGAGTCLLQPFLRDAASLSLAPELSQAGGVEEQDSLHIPATTEPTRLDFGFVKVTRISDLFSV